MTQRKQVQMLKISTDSYTQYHMFGTPKDFLDAENYGYAVLFKSMETCDGEWSIEYIYTGEVKLV